MRRAIRGSSEVRNQPQSGLVLVEYAAIRAIGARDDAG
jgi:hypothetical protein